MDISIFIQWFTFSRENIKHWQIWMSDEGHNCFIIVFSTVVTYNNSSYYLVSYRSMSPTTKENIRHIYQPVWQSLPYIFFFHLIFWQCPPHQCIVWFWFFPLASPGQFLMLCRQITQLAPLQEKSGMSGR